METEEPFTVPFNVPLSVPLLLPAFVNVALHVPDRDVSLCAIVACIDPAPARLSEMVPDHVPVIDEGDGDVGDGELLLQPAKSTMAPRRRTGRHVNTMGFSIELERVRRVARHP